MRIYTNLRNFLFFDIETVSQFKDYAELLKHRCAHNWERVGKRFMKEENLTIEETYEKKAALYVEYGMIVSICVGGFDSELNTKIGAIPGEDEVTLLNNFVDYLNKRYENNPDLILCGHNIKEFDIPYIIKRLIKHKIKLPKLFYVYMNAKSWEVPATDTQYDWRMAGNRFMNLDTIAEFLGIESSKEGEINGEKLGDYYWNRNNYVNNPDSLSTKIQKINTYCKADVRVLTELALRFNEIIP